MEFLVALVYFCSIYFTLVNSIMFHLYPNTQKCLREELRKDAIVVGLFEVSGGAPGRQVDYVVQDSKHEILAKGYDITKGRFSFSIEHQDMYEICFISKAQSHLDLKGSPQEVTLTTKRDVEAKTYEALGEAGKLKPMEIELKKLEDLSASILQDFALMREREVDMRDTNESTNNRVLYLSVFSMICLLSLSVWQVLYLRKFFKSRKLIE